MSNCCRRSHTAHRATLLALAVTVSACGPRSQVDTSVQDPGLAWPPPPDVSRVRYLRSLATAEDVVGRRSLFGRLVQLFTGEDARRVQQPYGVAADQHGRIYVADAASRLVHVFDPERTSYEVIRGPRGARPGISDARGEFRYPVGVTIDDQGRVYVSDAERRIVVGLDRNRRAFWSAVDSLLRPAGIVYNPVNGLIYVADVLRNEVRAYDGAGKLTLHFGGRGTDHGQFNYPTNLAVDRQGDVYVTDALNYRVQVFRPDGTFRRSFGRVGDAVGDFARPKGIGVDSEGHVYVVEGLFDVVNVFAPDGQLLLTFGSAGAGRGEFWLATGLFIDHRDRVYVADSYNGRVQVFQYLGGAR